MRGKKTVALPPAFNRKSFLEKAFGHLSNAHFQAGAHLSPMAELLIDVINDCLASCSARCDRAVDSWTKALIMTAVVEADDDALADYRRRLEGDPEWWPMVKVRWKSNCWDLGSELETELARHLKAQPVCTPEQFETLRHAIMQLTPECVLGEDFCKALNEPFMVTTFEERTEAQRLINALFAVLLTQWPKREDEADPWAPSPEQEQKEDGDVREGFFGPGSRVWLKAIAKPAESRPATDTAATDCLILPAAPADSVVPVESVGLIEPTLRPLRARRASRRAAARAVFATRRMRSSKRVRVNHVQGDAA